MKKEQNKEIEKKPNKIKQFLIGLIIGSFIYYVISMIIEAFVREYF